MGVRMSTDYLKPVRSVCCWKLPAFARFTPIFFLKRGTVRFENVRDNNCAPGTGASIRTSTPKAVQGKNT